jgi:predicted transcriptional regulator
MKLSCEEVARSVLPAFRSLIAHSLIEKHGFSQTAIAERLGSSQPVVSYYLSSKRGGSYIDRLRSDPQTLSTISELVNGLVVGSLSPEDITTKFCDMCRSLRTRNVIGIWNSHQKLRC